MPRPGCSAQCFGDSNPEAVFRDLAVGGQEPSPWDLRVKRARGTGMLTGVGRNMMTCFLKDTSITKRKGLQQCTWGNRQTPGHRQRCEDGQGSVIYNIEKVGMSNRQLILSSLNKGERKHVSRESARTQQA